MTQIQKRKRRVEDEELDFDDINSDNYELSSQQNAKRARLDSDNNGQVTVGHGQFENTSSSAAMEQSGSASNISDFKASNNLLDTALSKRAMKRAAIGHNVGSNDKPKGLTRTALDGSMEYFLEKENKWVPAVTHDAIREELIEEYDQQGTYDHGRSKGLKITDVTCFCASQKSWGSDPATWPQVLRQIQPTLKYLKGEVKLWYRHGKIVLDPDDRPVRLLDIPAVCSSKMEDWLMSAIFLSDPKVEILDIRARMPRTIIVSEKGNQVERPLYLPNALSMRMTRFRTKHGLMPREKRGGSKQKEERLKSFLGPERVKNNDLGDFKPLTRQEIAEVEAVNKGRFGYRARAEKRLGKRKENPSNGDESTTKKARTSKAKLSTTVASNSNTIRSGNAFEEVEPPFRQGLGLGSNLCTMRDQPFVPGIYHYDREATYTPYQPESLQAPEPHWEHQELGTESLKTSDNTLAGPSQLVGVHQVHSSSQENDLLGFQDIPEKGWNRQFSFADTYSGFKNINVVEGQENNATDDSSNELAFPNYPDKEWKPQFQPTEANYGVEYGADKGIADPNDFLDFPITSDKGWTRFDPLADAISGFGGIHNIQGHAENGIGDPNNVLDFSVNSDKGWRRFDPLTDAVGGFEGIDIFKGHAEDGIMDSHTSMTFDHTHAQAYKRPQFTEDEYVGSSGPHSILRPAVNSGADPNNYFRSLPSVENGLVEHVSGEEGRSTGDNGIMEPTLLEKAYTAVDNTEEKDNFDGAWAPREDRFTTLFGDYDVGTVSLENDEAGFVQEASALAHRDGQQFSSMKELLNTAEWDAEAWSGYL
ncbi:hypothetical protein MMC27_005205 [Xylographa pallens]|nr:hypothetical protein [Xylographa pallens]